MCQQHFNIFNILMRDEKSTTLDYDIFILFEILFEGYFVKQPINL